MINGEVAVGVDAWCRRAGIVGEWFLGRTVATYTGVNDILKQVGVELNL